jgi:hypothetical protein
MSTNHTLTNTTTRELIWYQLRSERENVCEALIKNSTSTNLNFDRLLQDRLCEIDDALDRLITAYRIDRQMIRRRDS